MSDWFKEWFASKEYLDVYSHRDEYDASKIVDLILKKTMVNHDALILDAACGSGRHTLLLTEKGFNVTSFDLSRQLLGIAKKEFSDGGLEHKLILADLRNIFFKVQFDIILNLFTSFGYFNEDTENFIFFDNSRSFLKKDGLIIFDYFNSYFIKENFEPVSEKSINGKKIIERRFIEGDTIIKLVDIITNKTTKNFTERVKLYSDKYLLEKFSALGFETKYMFGDYSGNSFNAAQSKRLILFLRLK